MNGNFYQNPTFPGLENPNINQNNMTSPPGNISYESTLPMPEFDSFIIH